MAQNTVLKLKRSMALLFSIALLAVAVFISTYQGEGLVLSEELLPYMRVILAGVCVAFAWANLKVALLTGDRLRAA